MTQKTYQITITKSTEAECAETMQAAADLVKQLKTADLVLLRNAIKRDPSVIDMARPFLKG